MMASWPWSPTGERGILTRTELKTWGMKHQLYYFRPQAAGREDGLCADNIRSHWGLLYQPRTSAAPRKGESGYTEGRPGSPAGCIITCWSPFLVFSVALTGWFSPAWSKWSCNQGLCHSPISACKCWVWWELISSWLARKESFLKKQKGNNFKMVLSFWGLCDFGDTADKNILIPP